MRWTLLLLLGGCTPLDVKLGDDTSPPVDTAPTGTPPDTGPPDTDPPDTGDPPDDPPCDWVWGAELTADDACARFVGEAAGDLAGGVLTAPGDVNGDGIGDLVMGAPRNDEVGESSGKLYFLLGRRHGWSLDEPLGALPALQGTESQTELSDSRGLGDVDADGLADVAAWYGFNASAPPGDNFVILGRSTWWTGTRSVETADGHVVNRNNPHGWTDFTARTIAGDFTGDGRDDWMLYGSAINDGEVHIISGADLGPDLVAPEDAVLWITGVFQLPEAGDLNGDGCADLLVEDHDQDLVHVVLGTRGSPPHGVSLAEAADLAFGPFTNQYVGLRSARFVGDVDGDGRADLAVSVEEPPGGSRLLLFFGREAWPEILGEDDADVVVGQGHRTLPGRSPGDVNGDGISDLLIEQDDAEYEAEAFHVVMGRTVWPASLDLEEAEVHIRVPDSAARWFMPDAPGDAADLNGDGISDILLRSPDDSEARMYGGRVAVFLGRRGWSGEFLTTDADLAINGHVQSAHFGSSTRVAVTDLNGDGRDDLVLSSVAGPDQTGAGEVFIFFGQPGGVEP